MISFVAFAPQGSAKTYVNVITASAADSMKKPVLVKRQAYSNKNRSRSKKSHQLFIKDYI